MFSGRENPRGTGNVNMENLFAQILERKRRIVEQVQQQVDLFDQQLASKCLLSGVSPPSWLWSPSIPSQNSELNKEEIISGLLFPPSRPSIICPSGRLFPYQQPVSFLADNVVRKDVTSVANNPLEEQLLEEEQQHDLSHNLVRRVSNHSHQHDANIASPRDVHEEERLPESVSTGSRENQSNLSPEHTQNQRIENTLDATSPGRNQGKMVHKSVSTTGCERKPSSLVYCQDETKPNTCLDPGLPLDKIQRSKSRQKALELRSSAKASKSRSNCSNELKPSPGGNIGHEIASLRSDSVSEINLFKHDENDEGFPDEEENINSQDKEGDQCIKFSSATESSTPQQKVASEQKSSSGDTSASIVPESLLESGHVKEMNIIHTIETIDEVSAKVDEQVDDPQSRSCNETVYLDGGTRSRSSSKDSSKREHQKSSNSFSGDIPSRNSNPSHRADHEVIPQVLPLTNEVYVVTDAGTSIFQSEISARSSCNARGNRSKTEHSVSVESSSYDLEPRHSFSLLHGGNVKESLIPFTIDVEELVVENITSDNQSKEKGEGVKGSLIPFTIDVEGSNARGNRSKTEHSGPVESYSVDVEPRTSISLLQSSDVKESLIPSTNDVEGLVVENITSDDQSKENGDGVKESPIPSTIDAEGSNARGNRSKNEHSGSVESSSVDVEQRHSISLLQCGDVKESLIPSTIDVAELVVENITSDDQSKENGECVKESLSPFTTEVEGLVVDNITRDDQSKGKSECVDTNRCSIAGRVSQTGISTDETTFTGAIQGSTKTEILGFVESSSVELSRPSVMQSDDESVLLKSVPVTGEALLVEGDNAGESFEISSTSNLSQTDIKVVEPVMVESIVQESGIPEDLIDHSSCGSKVQPQGSLTKAGNNQYHGRLSRPRSSAIAEESENEYKALTLGFDRKSADEQLEVRAGNPSLRTHDLPAFVRPESPCFDDNGERSFDAFPMNSREKTTMEKAPTLASATRVSDVPSLTDFEVTLSADNAMNDMEEHSGLKKEMVPETESPASHTGLRVGENEPPESNTFTGQIDALKKRPQLRASSEKGVPPINRNIACTETGESHGPESSVQEFFCSRSSMEGSQLQNKRRRTLDKLTSREPSSIPGGDILDSDSVKETVHHSEEAASHNVNHYDVELQKIIGSAPSDHYEVELQKMIGSASSAELRFEEGYLFKEAGLISPASLSFRPEQLSVQRSHISPNQGFKTEGVDFVPFVGEPSHPFASYVVRGSDCSPCLSPLGLRGAGDGSPPVLEGFIIQTDDECPSGSKSQIKHDSFQLPRTTAESATMIEQIRKSACRTTPSLQLAKTFKFNENLDLDQSVSTELLDGMFFSHNLEGSSVFDNLGINRDYTGKLYTDYLPFSGAGSSADARNHRTSPNGKLWYRSLQTSSSSEKRGSQTPDLPCISEENENVDEEPENLCTNTPKSISSEKRGSSVPDLPCITEEKENIDEIAEAVNEVSDSERENVSAERKPLADVNEDPMKFLPSVSKAKLPVDRQSLDSVNTAFSFSATCNNSVKSKLGRQNGGSRRFTGKENQGGAGAGRNVKPPRTRFSKAKLSCNSSLTTVGPRLPEKEPRHNNIVSNITSFVPLVQQQKPAPALITGKRDVKVKALEAAEASKRIAEQKENDRKMKKEAMKLERARLEQENLRKQEMEKKKKEEERKKKEAEMAWKQEMEKKKKEEERKRKEFEMADRKRQREEEKKLKEAKRQRVAEMQRQQKEADEKLQAEKELKRQAMDAKIKALKELKEEQSNAEKTRGQANTKIPAVRSKSNSSDDTNASRSSRDDDFKVISNQWKMCEESYDISPYKCSDDENEDEDDYDNLSNNKFVPSWASKSNVLLSVISQQNRDPDITFPAKSFRNITQVLLPRKFRAQ